VAGLKIVIELLLISSGNSPAIAQNHYGFHKSGLITDMPLRLSSAWEVCWTLSYQ